jgi:hypothetical protein
VGLEQGLFAQVLVNRGGRGVTQCSSVVVGDHYFDRNAGHRAGWEDDQGSVRREALGCRAERFGQRLDALGA